MKPAAPSGRFGWTRDDPQTSDRRDRRHVHRWSVLRHAGSPLAVERRRPARPHGICLPRQRSFAACRVLSGSHGVCAMAIEASEVSLESILTCPDCGHVETETMPTNACQWFYDCKGCAAVLKPLPGDCCVFCSYATVPCPPLQARNRCCA